MATNLGNNTQATSTQAIERATGRAWSDWLAVFEAAGAAKLTHPEIARIARGEMPADLSNPDWWAQSVAIAFEQHAGLRIAGQSSTGDFRVSASRTVPFDRDAAIERWVELWGNGQPLGHDLSAVRRSRTENRTFWRAAIDEVGKLEVSAETKGDNKALVAVQLTGMKEATQIEVWRTHFKQCLSAL